jgi:hypothetical protein
MSPEPAQVISELMAALRQLAPYALTSARHNELLGLQDEAAQAWTAYRRAQWALRSAGGPGAGERPDAED